MSNIKIDKCLPKELTIESVEDILHGIGFPLDSTKTYPKRKLLFNPIIIFTFISLYTLKEILIISLNEENELIFKVLGSVGHFLGIRRIFSLCFILFSIMISTFQMIFYYNYRNGIKPTFLRVFQMMSGLVSPKSLGLTDEQQIIKLLKLTKTLVKCLRFQNQWMIPVFAFVFLLVLYIFNTNLMETVCYGIPNSIILMVLGNICH